MDHSVGHQVITDRSYVVHKAGAWWAMCAGCMWLSPPQQSESDAADRLSAHDHFAHLRAVTT